MTPADGSPTRITLLCGDKRYIEFHGRPVEPESRACFLQSVALQEPDGTVNTVLIPDGPDDLPQSVGELRAEHFTMPGAIENGTYLVVPGGVGCAWRLTFH